MRKEIKRYVIRSRWCYPAIVCFLIWSLTLVYAMLYDCRAFVVVYPLTIILLMLLAETVYIVVYENFD
ncbi:MAG: hypothetical protein QW667_07820 [Candidatus Bathyarchaeia archaeon]